MLLRSALVTIFALPALISGDQIPVVDGVLGGVPSADARNSSFKTLTGTGSGDPSVCTPGKLRGVVENSCICGGDLFFYDASSVIFTVLAEDTPGVYQASGYGDLAPDKSIWFVLWLGSTLCFISQCSINRFWFFAARKNPDKAPLITWFNGGVSDTVR